MNYGGSTGYGRRYRKRLAGSWGVVDVDDCCAAAAHLAEGGRADPRKLCITGGSAGGYTTLACLAFRCTLVFHQLRALATLLKARCRPSFGAPSPPIASVPHCLKMRCRLSFRSTLVPHHVRARHIAQDALPTIYNYLIAGHPTATEALPNKLAAEHTRVRTHPAPRHHRRGHVMYLAWTVVMDDARIPYR